MWLEGRILQLHETRLNNVLFSLVMQKIALSGNDQSGSICSHGHFVQVGFQKKEAQKRRNCCETFNDNAWTGTLKQHTNFVLNSKE